jgi:hypothetical protein
MTFPSFDTATSAWVPQAHISWSVGPAREFQFVRFPSRLSTEGEAMAYAVRMGEQWIDRRLKRVRRGIGARQARMLDMIQARRAESLPCKQHQVDPAVERHRQSFTFKQFKSTIARSGLDVKDELLHKSYAALVNLRRQQRLSWAEARKKVEQSQEELKTGGLPQRRPHVARLPLTECDWQRIG